MKLSDIRDLSKEDILAALGLATKPSTSERLLGTLGVFGIGLLVGAGAALLLAPKSGEDLREELGDRIRKFRSDDSDSSDASDGANSPGEART